MNLSLKFRKDPCFRWGDIQLLVTMYIWYYTLNYSQFLTENFDFFGTPSWKCFYIFSARYLSLKERKRIRAFLWKNEPRRTSALHMIWWHSANRDVLPGRFQPYMYRFVFVNLFYWKIGTNTYMYTYMYTWVVIDCLKSEVVSFAVLWKNL